MFEQFTRVNLKGDGTLILLLKPKSLISLSPTSENHVSQAQRAGGRTHFGDGGGGTSSPSGPQRWRWQQQGAPSGFSWDVILAVVAVYWPFVHLPFMVLKLFHRILFSTSPSE